MSLAASALAAALLLQPVLPDDGELRLVAVGTGGRGVDWTLDGQHVATTADGEAATVPAGAGPHELWAVSSAKGPWRALARPDGAAVGGAGAVPAWTAAHAPAPSGHVPSWAWPAGCAGAAAIALVRPRSLLQGWARRRGP